MRGAECSARRAVELSREQKNGYQEAVSLQWLSNSLAARGEGQAAEQALERAIRLVQRQPHQQFEGAITAYHAELTLQQGQVQEAERLADRACQLAKVHRLAQDFIRATHLKGSTALQLGDLQRAAEYLHHALQRARKVNRAQEEISSLVALAELHRRRSEPRIARELLEQLWDPAERGPYPLFHADALNVLAQIERDAGNTQIAITVATRAVRFAWCDSPPFAYRWGLEAARRHLRELGAPELDLPPFDPAAHESMPEVEIDPPDDGGEDDTDEPVAPS